MTAIVYQGDAGNLPLPEHTVDLVVTSPPYFGLRNYTDGGDSLEGQVGAEATPADYLDALMACTAEWVRVLKPGGSIFVNLGDRYSQRVAARRSSHQDGLFPDKPGLEKDWKRDRAAGPARMPYENVIDPATGQHVPEKSLIGLPWRYALRCMDELGLVLRSEIVWAKPNGLPESVRDRVRRNHEQVFHFTASPRYFAAVDEIREPHVDTTWGARSTGGHTYAAMKAPGAKDTNLGAAAPNPLGKLPGSVWTIATSPLKVPAELGIDHFAAFPPELVRRIILGWSPREVCTACGEGRRPVVQSQRTLDGQPVDNLGGWKRGGVQEETAGVGNWRFGTDRSITGYACACPEPTAPATPGVVLDPFGGTGTTALVASVHGRVGITVDLSADYCRLARWRTGDDVQRARAARVPKPRKAA